VTRLQIIGGGRMGGALLTGLVSGGWAAPQDLAVVEVDPAARAALAGAQPGLQVVEAPLPAVDALVAVKPHLVADVCRQLAADPPRRVLSIAAGVTTTTMEAALPPGTRVVRAMPNTPALVGAGVAAIAPGSAATDQDLAWAGDILRAVGQVVEVPEAQLDAVTGLSGSGPAYVLLFLEALVDAGVSAGLPRSAAEVLARHTILGTARLAIETGESPAELRAGVTTPAGTTAAGVRVLEQRAVRAAVIDAVAAATDRSRELAGPTDR
jgi:pyrroline-5-carboxylate reductase